MRIYFRKQSEFLIANILGCSLLRDAEYFNSGISKLDGGANLGSHLVQLAREKPIAQRRSSSNTSESAIKPSAQSSPPAASAEKT